jgi:PadR family transcriptional regulator AphA
VSLKHGILGLLNYKPMSGYDLTKVFSQSLNFFWTASTSQIYRELETMSESGWIEVEEERQRGHMVSTVYAINENGRKELNRWLSGPSEEKFRERSPFFIRFFFQSLAGPESLRASLNEYMQGNEALAQYLREGQKEIMPELESFTHDDLAEFCWSETVSFGLAYYRMQAQWAADCLEKLDAFEQEKALIRNKEK